ncbi:MAG: hypothetical protein ACAF41_01000 (plasmid) [Leptolyngbya sp. BL-A-14]
MNNVRFLVATLLITAATTGSSPAHSVQVAPVFKDTEHATNNSAKLTNLYDRDEGPKGGLGGGRNSGKLYQVEKVLALETGTKAPSLEDFLRLYERDDSPKGGRPIGICKIAPSDRGGVFLSDRPTFIWQGKVKRIEVRTTEEGKLVWSKDLSAGEQMATFPSTTPALVPGTSYKLVFDGNDQAASSFEIVPVGKREQLLAELSSHSNNLPQTASKSVIALKKATYLGEQRLWLDAFGILFSVKPSEVPKQELAAWNKGLSTIRQSVCKSE